MIKTDTAEHAKLLTEHRALEEEYSGQDEYPEEIDTRLGELEAVMETARKEPEARPRAIVEFPEPLDTI